MGANLQLATLVFGFLLHILDVTSDVYVALQYYKSGQTAYFIAAVVFTSIPVIIANIFATYSLRNKYKIIKGILCLTHFSIVQLFFQELKRWSEDNEHSHNGNHFSKCDCLDCKRRFKESTKRILEYTAVRYMETFAESAPQLCFQVMVKRHNGGPLPWYAIASIVLSCLSILWSIYCLKKTYWISRRVKQNLKPATFPKSSAIAFLLWQTLLLPARFFTFVILPHDFVIIFLFVLIHYTVIATVMQRYFPACSRGRCKVQISSFITSFPWYFHVSTSGLEVPNAYFHDEDGIAVLRKFINFALLLIPGLFILEASIVILVFSDLPNPMKYDLLGGVCGAILTATVVSLFYYKCCNPATRSVQVGVERGIINVVPINDDE